MSASKQQQKGDGSITDPALLALKRSRTKAKHDGLFKLEEKFTNAFGSTKIMATNSDTFVTGKRDTGRLTGD